MASSLDKCFEIIDAFDAHTPELSVTDLSRRLRIPASTVHRLLSILIRRGFVRQNPATRRYTLTMKFWEKGCLVVNWHDLTSQARYFTEELNRLTGETVTLGVMEDGYAVYVDEIPGSHPIGTQRFLGRGAPGHACATGKSILAHRPEQLEAVLRRGLSRVTDRTITTPEALLRELDRTRARGYAVARGEWLPHVVAVAAPVWNHSGRVVAAISVSSPAGRAALRRIEEVGHLVSDVATRLSKELGHVTVPGRRGRDRAGR
jgi:IclR family acetate operon transcriptional repressor